MRTALIDADTLVYQAGQRVEHPVQWSHDLWTLHAHFDEGSAVLKSLVDEIQEGLEADNVIMALTDYEEPNWRKDIYPEYKEHRKPTRRPVIWKPLREYIQEVWESFKRPTLEGDDVLGILMTHPTLVEGQKICVSIDKDMKTIPGLHLNYMDALKSDQPILDHVYAVSEGLADTFHLYQALMGDSTDGYSGAPGFGPKTAKRLLKEGKVLEPYEHTLQRGPRKGQTETRWKKEREGTPWEVVVSAYEKAGLNEAVALQNAQVARICRAEDYDFENKEVIPWTP